MKCIHETEYGICEIDNDLCHNGLCRIKEPQTNADKIRSMTDEELAEWMAINTDCFNCKIKNKNICSLDDGTCTEEWRFWLKSPVEQEVDERT